MRGSLFRPTRAQREQVWLWKADGLSDDLIARALHLSRNTLRKHFEHELRTGIAGKRAEVIGLLFESARRGSVAALKQLEAMTRVRSSADDR